MPARVFNAVVVDVPQVVPVAQHIAQAGLRDWPLRAPCRGWHPQARFCQQSLQRQDGVLARRELLKSHQYERTADRIKLNRAHLAAVHALAYIEVADWRPADRAAVASLVSHL